MRETRSSLWFGPAGSLEVRAMVCPSKAPGLRVVRVVGRQGARSHPVKTRSRLKPLGVVLGGVEAGEGAVGIFKLSRSGSVEGQAGIGTTVAWGPIRGVILIHFLVLLAHLELPDGGL
jgi:hypothetical protein